MPIKVVLQVEDNESLATLLSAVAGAAKLLEASFMEGEPEPERKKHVRYVGGHRNKGISGEQLLLDLIASKKMSITAITQKFVERNFSKRTPEPIAYRLRQEGRVRIENGMVELVK